MAGVSRDTVRKVEAIKKSAPAEVQQAVRAGDMSINLAAQVAELPEEGWHVTRPIDENGLQSGYMEPKWTRPRKS